MAKEKKFITLTSATSLSLCLVNIASTSSLVTSHPLNHIPKYQRTSQYAKSAYQ